VSKASASPTVTVFHVTPTENLASIRRNGINPEYHQGKRIASWYVHNDMITWAIGHCSARHHIPVDHLTVISVTVPRKQLSGTSMPGVYYTAFRLVAGSSIPAVAYFSTPEEIALGERSQA
jgi:hypothetical protein